jgi:hypothetical protein
MMAETTLDILLPHAGHRLVEQQHFWIERQRRGNFEHPLAAIGEIGGEADRAPWRADLRKQLLGAVVQPIERRDRAPELGRQVVRPLQGHADIVENGQMRKDRGDLEGAHQAHARHLVGRRPGDVGSHQRDRA